MSDYELLDAWIYQQANPKYEEDALALKTWNDLQVKLRALLDVLSRLTRETTNEDRRIA